MRIVDLVGRRFRYLVVIRKLESRRDGSVLWECLCDCGNTFQASTRHLNRKNNTVGSCGCMQHPSGISSKHFTGVGDISGHWFNSHVKHSANCKDRVNVELSIDIKYCWDLFIEQDKKCAFTKLPLVIHNSSHNNTASLDRIDNTKGYIAGNVRWVHKAVNMMKRVYSDEFFVEICGLVYQNRT